MVPRRSLQTVALSLVVIGVYVGALAVLTVCRRRRLRRVATQPLSIVVTGRYDSQNWSRAHLYPLLSVPGVQRLLVVADGPVPEHERLERIPVPRLMARVLGRAAARSLWTAAAVLRHRPDIVLGYHFFPAGVAALLAARMTGAYAVCSLTSGTHELLVGGLAESKVLGYDNPLRGVLHWFVLRLLRRFDAVAVRGARTREFIEQQARGPALAIIPGAVMMPSTAPLPDPGRPWDVAFIGRLVPIKQPEQLLRIAQCLRETRTHFRMAVAGDGPLRASLEAEAQRLGLSEHVSFLGHVVRPAEVLARSRCFVLTSRTEGLSIALAEAMIAGAVPVVADVGDLGELVRNGVTGWRVAPGDISAFARSIEGVLDDDALRHRLSVAGRCRAQRNHSVSTIVRRWSRLFGPLAET